MAAVYDAFLALSERGGMADRRRRVLAKATGRTIELGAGTGQNLAHYPQGVTELVLTEPAEPMARRLERRVAASAREAAVVRAEAERLPFEDGEVDTVVSTLVLCTVPDPEAALSEVTRVLRPGGRLLFIEHVRSESERLARWQDRLMRPWRAFGDGCTCNRRTLELISDRFELERVERETWRWMPPIVRPLISGGARR